MTVNWKRSRLRTTNNNHVMNCYYTSVHSKVKCQIDKLCMNNNYISLYESVVCRSLSIRIIIILYIRETSRHNMKLCMRWACAGSHRVTIFHHSSAASTYVTKVMTITTHFSFIQSHTHIDRGSMDRVVRSISRHRESNWADAVRCAYYITYISLSYDKHDRRSSEKRKYFEWQRSVTRQNSMHSST